MLRLDAPACRRRWRAAAVAALAIAALGACRPSNTTAGPTVAPSSARSATDEPSVPTPAASASNAASATAGAADDVALRWSVSQGLWGTEIFEVRRDGRGHYSFEPVPPGGGARSFDVPVAPDALTHIAETAARVGFCAERSERLGIPDEGHPTLALALPGAACEVSLWDGEWRDRPGPAEVERLVRALHAKPSP